MSLRSSGTINRPFRERKKKMNCGGRGVEEREQVVERVERKVPTKREHNVRNQKVRDWAREVSPG